MTEILSMVYINSYQSRVQHHSIHLSWYLPYCYKIIFQSSTLSLTSADIGMGRAAAYAYCDPVIVQDSGVEYRDSMVKVMRFP